MRRLVTLIAGILIIPAMLMAQLTQQWVAECDYAHVGGQDYGKAIAFDGSGNVYVAGYGNGPSGNVDYVTIKYDASTHEELWVRYYNGTGNNYDCATAIVVDAYGVYVTGYSYGSTGYDYATVKYDFDGNLGWPSLPGGAARYSNNVAYSYDQATAIASDGYDVYVTGYSWGSGSANDYATLKYRGSDGGVVWTQYTDGAARYNGPSNSEDLAKAIAVDGLTGSVYVTGGSRVASGNYDYATVKYDASNGNLGWPSQPGGAARYDYSGSDDKATAVAVDGEGNAYVTGYSAGTGTGYDYATIRYDCYGGGTASWTVRYHNYGNGSDQAFAIAVDGANPPGVYVTGCSWNGWDTYFDYATIKYRSTDGGFAWASPNQVALYDGPAHSSDLARAIALDASGNAYVTGYSPGSGTGSDYATLMYDGANGNQLDCQRYTGPGANKDDALCIATGPHGVVAVSGQSYMPDQSDHIVTIKYRAGTSPEPPERTWSWGPNWTTLNLTRFDGEYFPGTNKVYFLGGRLADGTTTGAIWSYDPATQTYADMNVALQTPISNYDVVYLRDNWNLAAGDTYGLYVVGGRGSGVMIPDVQVYYPRSNTVRTVTTDPYEDLVGGYTCMPGGAVACGNMLYTYGGFHTMYWPYVTNHSYVYDPLAAAGSRWTRLSDLPLGRGYMIGAVVDLFVYACGGDTYNYNGGASYAQKQCWKLNTLNPGAGWSAIADMPDVNGESRGIGFDAGSPYTADGVPMAQKFIVPGRGVWPNEDSACYLYNTTTNAWSQFPKLNVSRRNHAVAFIPGTAGTNGVPGMWVWGGRHTSDAWLTDSSEFFQLDKPTLPPGAFDLIAPANQAIDQELDVTLEWNASDRAEYYEVYLGTDNPPTTKVAEVDKTTTTFTPPDKLTSSTVYYWYVKARNDGGEQSSAVWWFKTGSLDVGVTEIVAPTGIVPLAELTPQVKVRNYGTLAMPFDITFHIKNKGSPESYDRQPVPPNPRTVPPDNEVPIWFEDWTPTDGYWTATCKVSLPGDENPANDELSLDFIAAPYGWSARVPLPTLPSGRKEGNGGWLAYDAGTGLIFAAKGESTSDFYSFDPVTNTWEERDPIPTVQEKQGNHWVLYWPGAGCRGVSDGNGTIYMTLGNKTKYFLSYTSAGGWTQLEPVPAKVFKGTDIAFANGSVYLLNGNGPRFYRHDPAPLPLGTWVDLGLLPGAPSWTEGSWLVYDGDHTLYAQQAQTELLWAYDLDAPQPAVWTSLLGMPSSGTPAGIGGAGAFLDGVIYALKGSKTSEFWECMPGAPPVWTRLDDIPAKVKDGGDICANDNMLFAFSGMWTNQFWRYVRPVGESFGGEGVGATTTALPTKFALSVEPSLMRLGAAIRYSVPTAANVSLKLYDITGSLARTIASGRVKPGRYAANLSAKDIARGVYILKLESDAGNLTRKVVVE